MAYPYTTQYYQHPQVNMYRQQQPWTTQQIRPVSSFEEVRASPIEFDGSVFYFPDIANKRIYTKSANMDGTVAINLYELKDLSFVNQQTESSYVTRGEFEQTIATLKQTYEELLLNQKSQQEEQSNFKF